MRKQFSTVLIAVLLVVSVIGLSGCSMRPFQEGNADVSVTVQNAFWTQSSGGAERFLLPGDDTVYLEVRKGNKDGSLVTSATGKLVTEMTDGHLFSYSVIPLTRLPLYVDLFITAETRRGGEAVSRATAPLRIDDAKFEGMFLSLLPLPTHPDLADFSDGMALSLPAGESRILRFTPPTTEGSFNWPTAGTADMFFQIRDGEGNHVTSGKLPDISGTTGCIYFPIGSGSPWYLVLHNAGATAITGITLTSTNAVTLSYNITYVLNSGTNHPLNPSTYTSTETVILESPTRSGYSFAGWYSTDDFAGAPITEIPYGSTGNRVFHAKWESTSLTVAIDFSTPTMPAFSPVGPYIVASTGSVSLAVGTGTEGYTGYQWLLNGTALTGFTSYNCTINLASQGPLIHIGLNRVTVIVQIGGAYYSAFVDITITE